MQAGPHWWHKHWLFILEQTMMEGGMQGGSGGGQQAGGGGDLAQAAMLNFGKDFMRQHMEGRLEKAVPFVGQQWETLRDYFEVDTRYVIKKLYTVLFSLVIRPKKWKRGLADDQLQQPQQQDMRFKKFAPPTQDENAPDLYLPLMSFVTYIVVCSYIKGTNGKFTPEVLSQVMYTCLGFQCVEVLVMRLSLYILHVSQAPLLDLVAITGYKYVGCVSPGLSVFRAHPDAHPASACRPWPPGRRRLCVNMVVGMMLGRTLYYVSFLWTGVMASYFTVSFAPARPLHPLARRCALIPVDGRAPLLPPAPDPLKKLCLPHSRGVNAEDANDFVIQVRRT